jgi:hypothetical protein
MAEWSMAVVLKTGRKACFSRAPHTVVTLDRDRALAMLRSLKKSDCGRAAVKWPKAKG